MLSSSLGPPSSSISRLYNRYLPILPSWMDIDDLRQIIIIAIWQKKSIEREIINVLRSTKRMRQRKDIAKSGLPREIGWEDATEMLEIVEKIDREVYKEYAVHAISEQLVFIQYSEVAGYFNSLPSREREIVCGVIAEWPDWKIGVGIDRTYARVCQIRKKIEVDFLSWERGGNGEER